jgi:hypothetical protein
LATGGTGGHTLLEKIRNAHRSAATSASDMQRLTDYAGEASESGHNL